MVLRIDIYPYVFVKPGPTFEQSDQEKFAWPEQSVGVVRLEDYPVGHEVLGAIVYFNGPFTLSHPMHVTFRATNEVSGAVVWEGSGDVPANEPGERWDWYKWKFWVGHADWEVAQATTVMMDLVVTLEGVEVDSKTVFQEVSYEVPSVGPPEGWWQRLWDFLYDVIGEGVPVEEARVKHNIFLSWIGNVVDVILDGYSYEITPEGEKRVILISAGAALPMGKLPKITSVEADLAVEQLGTKLWLKAIDTMKLNPLKYVSTFKGLPERVQISVLQTLRKDVAGSLARDVFGKAFDEELLAKAPLWKRLMFSAEKHRWTGFFGLVGLAGAAMTYDTWGNWPLVDNLQYMSGKDVDDIKAAFSDGTMSREDALKELNMLLSITEAAKVKVKTSYKWNVIQMIFLPMWDDLAALTVDKVRKAITEVEAAVIPARKGTLKVQPTPADAKVSVDKLPFINSAFEQEVDVGAYHVLVTKWGYVSQDKYLEVTETTPAVWQPVLEQEVAPPPEKAKLTISVTPDGSAISISNHPEIAAEGDYFLDEGKYTIRVTLGGYKDETAEIYLKAGEPYVYSVILQEKVAYGTLNLSFSPSDVVVGVSNHPEIRKAGSYRLETGNYTITFTLSGYKSEKRTVYLEEYETENVAVTLIPVEVPPEEKGTLMLSVVPYDAVIEVAGYPEISMPGTYVLDPGTVEIIANREGYEERRATAYIRANVTTSISLTLPRTPLPPEAKAELTVLSEPTNADVYINGVYTYTTTPYTTLLDPGVYVIRCQTSGYYPYEARVTLKPGDLGTITLPLTAIPVVDVPTDGYVPWIIYLPWYVPPEVPDVQPLVDPYTGLLPPGYNYLDPPDFTYGPDVSVERPYMKELIVNVETTDVLPFNGRITSIAFIDLTGPGQEGKVITGDDEQEVLKLFLDYFDRGGFTKVVGFNVSFDHRFIFTKSALYRRPAKLWAKVELRDVMQILQQVKEAYVYGFNKPGTLDDWSKHLLGRGKYGPQEEVLQRFIRKDFDYVDAFNLRQVELVRDLYQLLRFTLSEAVLSALQATPAATPEVTSERIGAGAFPNLSKRCPTCLQANPFDATSCMVCGTRI